MATTFTGLRVQDTYNAILKIGDNTNLTGTAKLLSDGLGNASAVYLSTTRLGIGVTPTYQFQTSANAKIGGNLIIAGDLTVNGTTTIIDSTIIAIGDNMIEMAKGNTANTKDIGWYGKIVSTGTKYVGMAYDASTGIATPKFNLGFGTVEPGNTFATTVTGTLVANLEGNVTGNVTGGTISGTTGTFSSEITANDDININSGKLVVNDTQAEVRIKSSSDTGESFINFADTSDNNVGQIHYGHADNKMVFRTNDTQKLLINDTGEFIIGTGTNNAGFIDFDGTNLQFNTQRNPNDGNFVDSNKSHAHIGLQGADGGSQIIFGTASANNTLATTNLTITPTNSTFTNNIIGTTATFTGLVTGIAPTSDLNFATKKYVDDSIPVVPGTPSLSSVLAVGNTSGSNNIIMSSTAKIGINIGTPESKLDVREDANNVYTAYFYNSDTGANANGINVQTASTNANAYAFRVNSGSNSNALTVMGNANIGIGTSTPSFQLSIENHATTSSIATMELDGKRTNGTDGAVGELIFSNNGDTFATVAAFRDGADNAGSFQFQTQNSAGFSTKMAISTEGCIGIGTTTPTARLDVLTNSATGDNDIDRTVRFRADNGEQRFLFNVGRSGNGSLLSMYDASEVEKIRLSTGGSSYFNGGSLGIGTTSPDRSLDVEGDGMAIFGTGGYTELMIRGQDEGVVRNVGAFHLSIRSDVGGDNDDLKFLRFINGSYTGIAMQIQNTTGTIIGNGIYTANNSIKIFEAQRNGGAVASDWSYDDATTDMSLGTSTAHSFSLKTGNTRRMVITSAGRVAIKDKPNSGLAYDVLISVGTGADGDVGYQTVDQLAANIGASTSSNWVKTGNDIYNSNTGNVIIGNTNVDNPNSLDKVLEIEHGGSVGLILNDSRDTPIGLENRGAVFHLTHNTNSRLIVDGASGNVQINPGSLTMSSGAINAKNILFSTAVIPAANTPSINLRDSNNEFYFQSGSAHIFNFIRYDNRNTMMNIDSTGINVTGGGIFTNAVGIGTTSPNAKLEVASGQAKTVTSGVEFARFGTSNEASNYATLNCEMKGGASAADRKWIFQTIEAGVANAGNIVFQPDGGKIGIGTDSPDSKLDVVGEISASDDINTTGKLFVNKTGAELRLKSTSDSGESYINFADPSDNNVGQIFYGHSDNRMIFRVNDDTRMYFNNAGNIGIGTTTPDSPADVGTFLAIQGRNGIGGGTAGIAFKDYDNEAWEMWTSGGGLFVRYNNTIEGWALLSNGKMGVGTTNATERLTLQCDAQNDAFSGKNGNDYLWFLRNEAGAGARQSGRFQLMDTDVTTVNIESASNRNTYFNAGFIGIGHTNPSAKLDVRESANNKYTAYFYNSDTGGQANGVNVQCASTNNDVYVLRANAGGDSNALVVSGAGNVGVGKYQPGYKLDVTGTIRATSDVIAFSDKRVKENIITIDNALNKVSKLRGVTYTRKDIDDKTTKVGVIAQEVLEVLPEVVEKDDKGLYSVAYGNMAGVFIEAIKELKAEVDSLKQEIKELKK
jgi:hypothetical protein